MALVTESIGDIFSAPEGSMLMHACNCKGEWGAGVAKVFRDKFPAAYQKYWEYCCVPGTPHTQKWLVGTALIIPPQEDDAESGRYWLVCLMTSLEYGRNKANPDEILENTRKALLDLKKKMAAWEQEGENFENIWSVRMNAKLFRVPWLRTKKVLEQSHLKIHVVRPEGEDLKMDELEKAAANSESSKAMDKSEVEPSDERVSTREAEKKVAKESTAAVPAEDGQEDKLKAAVSGANLDITYLRSLLAKNSKKKAEGKRKAAEEGEGEDGDQQPQRSSRVQATPEQLARWEKQRAKLEKEVAQKIAEAELKKTKKEEKKKERKRLKQLRQQKQTLRSQR